MSKYKGLRSKASHTYLARLGAGVTLDRRGQQLPRLRRQPVHPWGNNPWNMYGTNLRIWFPGSFPESGPATTLTEPKVSPPGSLTTLPQRVGRSWSRIPAGKTRRQRGGGHEQNNSQCSCRGTGRNKTPTLGQHQRDRRTRREWPQGGSQNGNAGRRSGRRWLKASRGLAESRLSTWGPRSWCGGPSTGVVGHAGWPRAVRQGP